MKIRRINDNTISCIISPEDLKEHGIRIDDFFERKKEDNPVPPGGTDDTADEQSGKDLQADFMIGRETGSW